MDGAIMVDGVLASCYASADHDLAHIVMTPIRWFPEMIDWIFEQKNGNLGYTDILEKVWSIAGSH